MFSATRAALLIRMRCRGFCFLGSLFCGFQLRALTFKLLVNLDDLGVFRRVQAIFLLLKAHATRLKLRDAFFSVGFFQIRQLRVAVNRIERLLNVRQRSRRGAQCQLGNRQRNVGNVNKTFLIGMLGGRNGDGIVGIRRSFCKLHRLLLRRNQPNLTLLNFAGDTLRMFALERELLLGARDLGVDFVERALCGVLRVVLGENVLTEPFELRHQRLHLGLF